MKHKTGKFMSWRDLIISPLTQLSILVVSGYITYIVAHTFRLDLVLSLILFYVLMIILTICFLRIFLIFSNLKAGTYTYTKNPKECYAWNLFGYLCITNLSLIYTNELLPIPFRKFFYAALKAKMGSGIISIGGKITEPYMTTIEEDAVIGDGALILGHVITAPDILILGKVHIKKKAIVGARCVILPGVVVGENSVVTIHSVVARNTIIPDNEIWGGNPACKIKDVVLERNPS